MQRAIQDIITELKSVYLQLRDHGQSLLQLLNFVERTLEVEYSEQILPRKEYAQCRAEHLLETMALFEILVEKVDTKIKALRARAELADWTGHAEVDADPGLVNQLNLIDEAMEEIWEMWEEVVGLRGVLTEVAAG